MPISLLSFSSLASYSIFVFASMFLDLGIVVFHNNLDRRALFSRRSISLFKVVKNAVQDYFKGIISSVFGKRLLYFFEIILVPFKHSFGSLV